MILVVLFYLLRIDGKFSNKFGLWLLMGIFVSRPANGQLMKYGNVSYQNAVIYDVANPKNLQLRLFSETGDADLYVFRSSRFDKADMNFSDYQFKSDSFGIDTITIGKGYDVASHVVVFGVAQTDSRFTLEISNLVSSDLDYSTIDNALQKEPGSSYEELCLQHSFDSDSYYAEEEKARLQLLSMDSYPGQSSQPSQPDKRKKASFKENSQMKSRKVKNADDRKSAFMDEDSFLYHFLLWLLEFIVDVFF